MLRRLLLWQEAQPKGKRNRNRFVLIELVGSSQHINFSESHIAGQNQTQSLRRTENMQTIRSRRPLYWIRSVFPTILFWMIPIIHVLQLRSLLNAGSSGGGSGGGLDNNAVSWLSMLLKPLLFVVLSRLTYMFIQAQVYNIHFLYIFCWKSRPSWQGLY